jgi:acyl phosphate:glycerol-3-phosphate acyltransferase
VISILISIALGYLLGSVPFGLLAGRLKGVDIRQHGSCNIGWKFGLPVFLLDAGKGIGAVALARWVAGTWQGDPAWCIVAGAMACILGHSFPIWLRFKGGKGVATSLGTIIGMMPVVSAIIFGVWVILFFATRYVSLASIIAAASFPVSAFFFHAPPPVLGFAVVSAILVIALHRGNIQRLLAGTERRAGARKKEVAS